MEAQIDTAAAPQMNRRQKAKAKTRDKVMDAARRLFEAQTKADEDGAYEQATMRDIAREAGMSTGAIFANFADKVALYTAIYGHAPVTPEQGRQLLVAAGIAAAHMRGDPSWDADAVVERLFAALASVKMEAA